LNEEIEGFSRSFADVALGVRKTLSLLDFGSRAYWVLVRVGACLYSAGGLIAGSFFLLSILLE